MPVSKRVLHGSGYKTIRILFEALKSNAKERPDVSDQKRKKDSGSSLILVQNYILFLVFNLLQ